VARRQVVEETVSHERWLISYADFITLLFAFFVVMYSISQVNEGKYKVLSETLSEVFSTTDQGIVEENSPERKIDPFQIGELAKSNPRQIIKLASTSVDEDEGKSKIDIDSESEDKIEKTHELAAEFSQISEQLEGAFGDLVRNKLLTVRGNEEWLEVELKSSLLFGNGDASLDVPALELLGSIAEILKGQSNPIKVEGFTDNRPIRTPLFPSNWELSTARASAVVQLFVEEGMTPSRFAVIGYGEHQPIADNDTEEGRSANRRVVLMISKTGDLRPSLREVASVDELIEKSVQTGIRINIPGVSPAEPEEQEAVAEDPLKGVETIELDGGGTLFTSGRRE
jgi:chemotaxis protein MotB